MCSSDLPGIEPMPPAVEAQSPNHWIAREVPSHSCINRYLGCLSSVMQMHVIYDVEFLNTILMVLFPRERSEVMINRS